MKAVLFDMDGVLVDVSQSYHITVQKTFKHFSGQMISLSLIQDFKNRGGLNNDWDLTESLLNEFGMSIEKQAIIDVFQKIYLGKNFDGLIRNEKWLLERPVLERIKKDFKTGIVTGRPTMESRYVLKRFAMEEFFPVLITMDDVPYGKTKPDPYGIQLALRRLNSTRGFYMGDSVDDMIAATRADVIPIGVVYGNEDPEKQEKLLRNKGAGKIVKNVNDILEVLE